MLMPKCARDFRILMLEADAQRQIFRMPMLMLDAQSRKSVSTNILPPVFHAIRKVKAIL